MVLPVSPGRWSGECDDWRNPSSYRMRGFPVPRRHRRCRISPIGACGRLESQMPASGDSGSTWPRNPGTAPDRAGSWGRHHRLRIWRCESSNSCRMRAPGKLQVCLGLFADGYGAVRAAAAARAASQCGFINAMLERARRPACGGLISAAAQDERRADRRAEKESSFHLMLFVVR